MELIEVKGEAWKIVYEALEIEPICSICGEKFDMLKTQGVMPPIKGTDKPTVICGTICLSQYYDEITER